MKYGLTPATIEKISTVFARFREVEKAVLYGSRAKGNFKPGSDIDLTLYGGALTADLRSAIASALDDLLLPHTIDLSLFDDLDHAKLREHIERVGVVFYQHGSAGKYQSTAMKNGWPTKTLGEACEIKPPKSEARKRLAADALVSFLPMENMGINEKFVQATQIRPLATVQGSYTYFADGDVLLAKITPCFENGKLGIAADLTNGIGFGSSEYIVFRPNKTLSKEWLYYYLSRETFRAEGAARMSGAVGHKRVSKEFIESYPVPIPPLAEQQRIVGLLDEAFAGIATAKANAKKNLQNARALFESYLQSVFTRRGSGWAERRLADIAEFKNGLNFTRQSNGQTLRMVGVGDFQERSIVPIETLQSVTIDGKLGDDYLIRRDDILTVRSNGSRGLVGRCMLVPDVDAMTSFSGFIIRIRCDTRLISPCFLLHFMKSSATRDRLTRDGGGANISNINQAKLSELPISLPSFKEQEDVANRLDKLDEETHRLSSLYERKLSALEALKKSLLYQAFTGEL